MGISVRALRHYDEIGLLMPAHRSSAGHRLYTSANLARLQKIVALRRMGFSIKHIRTVLSGETAKAYKTLEAQADRLRKQISQQQEVLKSVEGVLRVYHARETFNEAEI
jgi:DNA-binding transcriptional MerR regulator